MLKYAIQLLFLMFCLPLLSLGQNATLSGTIKDARNGEDLIGATVRVIELKDKGARSNSYGFYSLTLPKGNYTIEFQ
jgi:hypothetical protein